MNENEDLKISSLNIDEYDFIDLGCSKGNSLLFGVQKFDGIRGIGVDISPKKVKEARRRLSLGKIPGDHTVVCEDILNLPKYNLENKLRFTTCIHFLEHLYGFTDAQKILEAAIKISKEFVFITQPFADKDVELFKKGLKTYYSDWTGHTNLLTSYDFYRISKTFYLREMIKDFIIFANTPIKDSSAPEIHPITSPVNQHDYDKNIHPSKDNNIIFEDLYRDIGVLLIIDETIPIDYYYNKILGDKKIIYDSRNDSNLKIKEVGISDCDFVDIGCGNGDSLCFGVEKFGGKYGLGIDKNKDKLLQTIERLKSHNITMGLHKLELDILLLDTKDEDYYKNFRFTTCINVMQEFENISEVKHVINKFVDLSNEFIYITHENNDYNDYLNSEGLRKLHTRLPWNKILLTSTDYINILTQLKDDDKISNFKIYSRKPILDSSDNIIESLYEDKDKEIKELNDVYDSIDVVIALNDEVSIEELSKKITGEKKLIYSSKE